MLATVIGGVYFAMTIVRAANATQQIAGILQALGTALIPDIFTRSLEGLRHSDVRQVRIVGPDSPSPLPPQPREEPGYVIPAPPARR